MRARVYLRIVTSTAIALLALTLGPRADAAATFSLVSLDAQVSGSTVTSTAVVKASVATGTSQFGVCVRSASGGDADYPAKVNWIITTSGTKFSGVKTFSAGTYTYFVCVQVGGAWSQVGAAKSFTVPVVAAPASGMPVGNLPGWRQVYAEDFTTSAALGTLASSKYAPDLFTYAGYNDTSGRGRYNPNLVLSVGNSALDWKLHTANGLHNVAAVVPRIPATGWGQTYGRYSVRFRSDVIPGYKLAFMLWPDSDNWGEGEIDFPEVGALDPGNRIYANLYQRGNTTTHVPGPTTGFASTTDAVETGWHTATIEWAPNSLTYILDGKALGTLRTGVPNTSFHLVLQVETMLGGSAPANTTVGHVQVDWVTMYSYAP